MLPTLETELGPGVAEALARTAELLRDDTDLLDRLAADTYRTAEGLGASWRRYHVLMVRAECTGEQSTCKACRTYGRFKVMEPAPTRTASFTRKLLWASDESDAQLKVHCRVCGHEWLIE